MKTLWLVGFVLVSSLLFCARALAEEDSKERTRPNILMLIGDDIDRDMLGPWGGQAVTPHLDQLAADGVRFDKVYANVAMCAPFRQELYSGRTVWRTRAMPNHSRSKPDTKSLPHYLRPLGYQVGLLGKSHVGPKQAYPFDMVGGLKVRQDNNARALELAKGYIETAQAAEKPFCLVIAANDGHAPYTNGDRSLYDPETLRIPDDAIDTKEYRKMLHEHLAEVSHLDALLGELRRLLKEMKLSENTLVVYCSEQGSGFPFSKWTCFDDGLSSGVVAALPGVIPAGHVSTQLTWIADFTPSFIEAAGGTIDEADFDGRSQWANFCGGNEEVHRYAYGAFTNCRIIDNRDRVFPIRSIRDERYTLIWSPRAEEDVTSNVTLTSALRWIEDGVVPEQMNPAASWVRTARETEAEREQAIVKRLHHRPVWALYDRERDPEELDNRIADPALMEDGARLMSNLNAWLEQWDDADPVATERGFLKK